MMVNKILIIGKDSCMFVDPAKDLNTEFGMLKASEMLAAKDGDEIRTHKGNRFFVVRPTTPDLIRKVLRLPQIITLKDLGSIIVYTGIGPDSRILEAGTGSGVATCVLGSIAVNGEIVSYELRKDFIRVAKKNFELFGLKNVKIIDANIKDGVDEKDFDAALLDLPDPWEVLKVISSAMKTGARICCYLPSITQVERTIKELPTKLSVERLVQNLELDWKTALERNVLRPESSGITHTGFLLFLRKVEK